MPILRVFVVAMALLELLGGDARAAPVFSRRDSPSPSNDDAFADGDLDAHDIVGRSVLGRAARGGGSATGGETWLSLAGFTRTRLDGQKEIGGFVVVGLPLDRMAGGGARASAAPVGAAGVTAPPAASGTVPSPTIVIADETIGVTPRLARSTVEAAWRASGIGGDDGRLDSIIARARWSAILPETRLRAIRYEDQRLYTDASADSSRLRDTAGANVGLEARLTWRFDRLLYADDEPSFERMRLERHDARARIAARVLEALFHWHRAWLDVRWAQAASREAHEAPGRPTRDEIEAGLRMMEAEATLDVLTGGWFTSSRSRMTITRPIAPRAPAGPLPEAL